MKKQNRKEGKLSKLPVAASEFIKLVINKMRYRKQVREDVQAELAAHFEDELKGCKADTEREENARQLVGGFGDVKMLAVLLRRAKKRCRPLWRTVVARAFQTIGLLFVCLVLYIVWFLTGKPVVTTNYIAELNNMVRPVADESLNAAPLYNKASKMFEDLPDDIAKLLGKKYYEVTSEEKQVLEKWLTENEEHFQLVIAGSQKPYYWQHYEGEEMMSVLLPHLAGFRRIAFSLRWRVRLLADFQPLVLVHLAALPVDPEEPDHALEAPDPHPADALPGAVGLGIQCRLAGDGGRDTGGRRQAVGDVRAPILLAVLPVDPDVEVLAVLGLPGVVVVAFGHEIPVAVHVRVAVVAALRSRTVVAGAHQVGKD